MIEDFAFMNCTSLKEFEIPLGFAECTALKDVEFNVGMKWIGNSAFQGCTSLRKVRLPGNTEYTKGNSYDYDTFLEWTKVRN